MSRSKREPAPKGPVSSVVLTGLLLIVVSYTVSVFHVVKIRRDRGELGPEVQTVIRLVHYLSERNVQDAFNELARDYEALHPGVKIIIQSVPYRAYQQWLNTQQIGETTPDLFQLEARTNWTMAAKFQEVLSSYVGEVNPYNEGTELEGVPWRDTYIDDMEGGYFYSLLEFYGIPMTVETGRIFYNKDIFRKAVGSDMPPKNFREWMNICAAIKDYAHRQKKSIYPIAVGREGARGLGFQSRYVQSLTGGMLIPYDTNAHGGSSSEGQLWGLQTGTLDFKQDRIKAAFDLQIELAQNFQPGFISDMADQARFLFVQEHAAMVAGSIYDLVLYKETANFDFGVFDIPLPDEKDSQYGKYFMGPPWEESVTRFLFGLSKTSRHKEAAIDFMKFCTSVDNNEKFCRKLDWYPAIRTAETTEDLLIFAPNSQGVASYLVLTAGPEIELYFDHNYFLFLGGHLSFDEFMDGLTQMWLTKGEEWLLEKRDAISKQETMSSERNLARSRVKLLFEEAGEMRPGQTMGTGTSYQLGVQIVQAFFGQVFTYRQYVSSHIKNNTYQFPPHNLMPPDLFPIPPPSDVLENMRKSP